MCPSPERTVPRPARPPHAAMARPRIRARPNSLRTGTNAARKPANLPETAQQTEIPAERPAQESSIGGIVPRFRTVDVPRSRGLGEREPVSSSGVRLLPSFATPGPDAKNLLATRLLVSLPTGRVVSFFHRSRSWQGAHRTAPGSLLPSPPFGPTEQERCDDGLRIRRIEPRGPHRRHGRGRRIWRRADRPQRLRHAQGRDRGRRCGRRPRRSASSN
jgi:hypothetical protein